jgi:hypothetical protein
MPDAPECPLTQTKFGQAKPKQVAPPNQLNGTIASKILPPTDSWISNHPPRAQDQLVTTEAGNQN